MSRKSLVEKQFGVILGKKLRERRENMKITQQRAAEKADESRQWLGEVERGLKTPSIFSLFRYTSSVGFDVLELLDDVIKEIALYMEKKNKD